MKKNFPYLPKRSSLLILAVAMASSSAFAAPGYELYLKDNQLTISSGGSGTSFSQVVGISSTGALDAIANVPSTNGVGIPSFTFTILKAGTNPPAATYQFEVAIVIDDQNSQRQMEAYIGDLQLTVDGSGGITGTIPNQTMELKGRDGSGAIEVSVNVSNAGSNGPVTITGGTVSFDAVALLDKLKTNATFSNIILDEFDDAATYNFRIAVKQVGPSSFAFGTYADSTSTFSAFPTNTTTPAFALSPGAQGMTSPYSVTGSFNVVYVAPSTGGTGGGGGGGGANPGLEQAQEELNDILDGFDNTEFPPGVEIALETITKINDALVAGDKVADNAVQQALNGTLTPENALAATETVLKALNVAGNASSSGGTVSKTQTASTIDKLSTVLGTFKPETITTTQLTQVTNAGNTAIANAAKTITGGNATKEEVAALVTSATKVFLQVASLSNGVSADVAAQGKSLSAQAVNQTFKLLPASFTAGKDTTSLEGKRALIESNAVVRQAALLNSMLIGPAAAFKQGFTVDIGGVKKTIAELMQEALAAALGGAAIQGIQSSAGGFAFVAPLDSLTVTTDAATGKLSITSSTDKYVALSTGTRVVSDDITSGISYLPDGRAVLVANGYAIDMAPTAFDTSAFNAAVASDGYTISYRNNGTVEIALAGNERFSGAFAYDNLGGFSSCGTLSVAPPTGNPASPGYAFVVNCSSGAKQLVTPIADNAEFYNAVGNAGLDVTTDRNTGVVTIPTVGSFKPSFFVTPLSVNDTAYYNAIKNAEGIAFRAKDANGDGKTDYEVISANGIQLMYGQ